MNRKSIYLLFIILNISLRLFSENILLAPIISYDEQNKRLEIPVNPNVEFFNELSSYWFERSITFEVLKESKYGAINSVVDAQRACNLSESQYIVYGYIQKNSNYWYGNIKLYDNYSQKICNEFFVSDGLKDYDRFLSTLTQRILEGFEQLQGIDELKKRELQRRPFEIRLPASLFYWSPIGEKWNYVYMGIMGVRVGVELFPPLKSNVIKTFKYDFSGQFRTSYQYGMEREGGYPLNYHNLSIEMPAFFHIYFTKYSSVYAGTGFFYEFEIMNVANKYESAKLRTQSMYGILSSIGYEYNINNSTRILLDIEGNFHLSNDKYYELKTSLGVSFKLFEEKKND